MAGPRFPAPRAAPARSVPPRNRVGRALAALALVALVAAGLTGCADSPVVVKAARAIRTTVAGAPGLEITREQVSKLPYASMAARVGRGVEALVLLSHAQGDERYWLAGSEAVLVLRYGRLVRTSGFAENLVGSRVLDEDPLEYGAHRLDGPRRFTRLLDTAPSGGYEQPVDCEMVPVGPRKITIVEIEFDTKLVREDCTARRVHWSFTNYYWVDPVDGFVWRSKQYFVRSQPALAYSVLKPAG